MVEQPFSLHGPRGVVPGLLWTAESTTVRRPLVLLGHGGSGHKRAARIVELGRWFVAERGIAAAAIDGPYHGDRVPAPLSVSEYQRRITAEGPDAVVDRMVVDWQAVVDEFRDDGLIGSVGYVGMSMGARFGLPFAAATCSLLRCGVFGKFGLDQAGLPCGMEMRERIQTDA